MLRFAFNKPLLDSLQILCLGAHCDDIEIGCGGTLLRIIAEHPNLTVYWIVFDARGQREIEAQKSAQQFLSTVGGKHIFLEHFRDGFFPYIGGEIKEYFEHLKSIVSPDLIFTHYRHDLHQDHRLLCELTWNTFRDHLILEYEIPKYDGDLGSPNFFVNLDENICNRKIEYISTHFKTQENRHWFTKETFLSLLRLRGIESKAPSGYAEAFYGRKIVL